MAPATTPATMASDPLTIHSIQPALLWAETVLEYFAYGEYFGQVPLYNPVEDLASGILQQALAGLCGWD